MTPIDRHNVWRSLGASEAQAERLRAYASSPLHDDALPPPRAYPLPDAPCIAYWERYVDEARGDSDSGRAGDAIGVLRRVFVQLRFPIAEGMSRDSAYLAATRRGEVPRDADLSWSSLPMSAPDRFQLLLHPTAVGRVPVIVAGAREDFETLVRAIARRNEPDPIPPSMGACLVAGYNNWDRVASLRRAFAARHPDDIDGAGWAAEFRALIPRKTCYQDRFMILSAGGYSATPADAIGLADDEWLDASLRLRLEHECAHYVARELIGVMRESLLDELVADYVGLVAAFGQFKPETFLRFLGLEAFPRYRAGGRLENYRGSPPLTDEEMAVLRTIAVRAAETLGDLPAWRDPGPLDSVGAARVILTLLRVGLEGLASPDAALRLALADVEARASVRES